MPLPTVIFAHGRESGPWGNKIRCLAKVAEAYGCSIVSRDDQDTQNPELRTARMIKEAKAISGPLILVGSSMGGYVTAKAAEQVETVGLFLMAPAFGLPGYADPCPHPVSGRVTVVHGWDDDVVPFDAVAVFAKKHRARLHLLPAGHGLIEEIAFLEKVFALFLQECLAALQPVPDMSRLTVVL